MAQGTCPDGVLTEEFVQVQISVVMPIAFIEIEHPETATTDCGGTEP